MAEAFSDDEKRVLAPFVSSVENNIFVLRNLPEVIKGALFSRYSRSTKSLKRLLLDEFIGKPETGFAEIVPPQASTVDLKEAVQKAQAFYDRILDGFGDDSVGELGGAHVACEFVSNIAAKQLEDCRIGGSPLEKSTRYIWFTEKINGDYMFYKEPVLMKSKYGRSYTNLCNLLFDTYTKFSKPMTEYVEENMPVADFMFFDIKKKQEVPFESIKDEKQKKRALSAYNASVRAKACDVLRGFLPASTLTNLGLFGNGRFFQNLLTKLHSSPLAEFQDIGQKMHNELDTVIPSFVRRAAKDEFIAEKCKAMAKNGIRADSAEQESVTLVSCDKGAENELIAKMLYPYSNLPLNKLVEAVDDMSEKERMDIVADYIGERRTRRDKVGRAFESIYYGFDILADFGIYRDIQRHRVLSQERQMLSTNHGYNTPEELVSAGFKKEFDECMKQAKEVYDEISPEFPLEAQYAVPFAYNLRWYMKLNLREAFHLCELRSTPHGHQNYRKLAQDIYRKIEGVHPAFAKYMKFMDLKDYKLGRLRSETIREEEKAAREE
ncbi:FAD-dependent thymidylate synthase [Candidatus Woesearchaeota archaeon]|nr:FAD-dependent thymidylate synthase [Candidatus Woesearchaeota archaeon]